MQDKRQVQVQPEARPLSRGSRPISVKSSSTQHKRTQSPKTISTVSQKSNALSEHHFREGDILLKEHNLPHCYESYRQGFKALKLQQGSNTAGFESRFTSRCAILLSQAQKYLDDKQSEAAKELAESVLALCEEFSDITQTHIPITSSFLKSQVGLNIRQPVMYAPVRFNALNKLGLCERQLTNFEQGLDHLLSAIDIGQQHGLNVGETWVNVAAVYMSMKNWRKGRHASQEALKSLSQENESPYPKKIARLLGIASYNCGKCNEKLNDLQEAIDNYRSGIKELKAAGVDPQEQVYKSISYAFLQAMKDFKDGAVKRKTIGEIVESGISEPKVSEKNSDNINAYKLSKSGQIRRPGTAMSAAHSKELEPKGFRSPMSNHTNPLSKSINLVNKSEMRGQLFSSLQKSQEVISDKGLKDSEIRGFFNTTQDRPVVRLDSAIKSGPVKSPWVIRSRQAGTANPTGRPPIVPNSNLHGGVGMMRERNTAPSAVNEFNIRDSAKYERKTHQGTYSGEGGWKESDSAIGVEESWDELAGQQEAAEKSKSHSKLGPRRSLATQDIMRENRLQLAQELKDINQRLMGMDLVPLRLPKQRNGLDDPHNTNTQPVFSGGARIGTTSSFKLKKSNPEGVSPLVANPKPADSSKKALVVLRKQNSQSGRTSQASGVQSADILTPTGNVFQPAKIMVSKNPQPSGVAAAAAKQQIKRIGSLSEPSPKHSIGAHVPANKPLTRQQAAATIQTRWRRDKLGVQRVKQIVRKKFPASTYVCTHYLKVSKMLQIGQQLNLEGSSAPAKILVFLHKESFLLVYFVLPSFIPAFALIPKTFNVLGHPEKLRWIEKDNKLYFESVKPEPSASKPPNNVPVSGRSQIGEETIRPLFNEEESVDQTMSHLRRPIKIPNRDLSQDDDLLQPLIPVSASGRGSQREVDQSTAQDNAEAEIQKLKEEILDEYLQDGVELAQGNNPVQHKIVANSPEVISHEPVAVTQKQAETADKLRQEQELAAQQKLIAEEGERIARQEREAAEKLRIQAEEAERLRKEQELLKVQLRLLQEEKLKQEQEFMRKKAEAELYLREQEKVAADLLKKQEEQAKLKADELKKKVEQDILLQKQAEEAKMVKLREEFILKQKQEEEQYMHDLAQKKLRQEQEELTQKAELQRKHEEKMAEEAKARAEAEKETKKKTAEVQNYKQGIALALLKKGQNEPQKTPTKVEKPAVMTKRYGDLGVLSEADKQKAEIEAAGFIQDYLKYNAIRKQNIRKGKVFLGSTKIELPENQYLLEAHRLSENPLQPERLDEIIVSGMGIIRLCVLKELRMNSQSKLSLGDDSSPKEIKAKVIEFMRRYLTIKDSSQIQYIDGYLVSDEALGDLRSSTQTAYFGQASPTGSQAPAALDPQDGVSPISLESKSKSGSPHTRPLSPIFSGETPTHQSLDLASSPLSQPPIDATTNPNPVVQQSIGTESSPKTPPKVGGRFGAMKPPMIMVTPAPPANHANPEATESATQPTTSTPKASATPQDPEKSEQLSPNSSRELFSFVFHSSASRSCRVAYKEPSSSPPIVEFYTPSDVFQGSAVCTAKIGRKEELGRLLRWPEADRLPFVDEHAVQRFIAPDAAVEAAGLF